MAIGRLEDAVAIIEGQAGTIVTPGGNYGGPDDIHPRFPSTESLQAWTATASVFQGGGERRQISNDCATVQQSFLIYSDTLRPLSRFLQRMIVVEP